MVNWVCSPGWDSAVIVPPCCLTISLEMLRPRPVPWSAALVVKNGLNILSMTSVGIPLPLSLTMMVTVSPVWDVLSHMVGFVFGVFVAALRGSVACVAHQIEDNPSDVFRDHVEGWVLLVELSDDVHGELGVTVAGRVVSQHGVVFHQLVDVDVLVVAAGGPAHGQHVLDDAVGAFAVVLDAVHVLGIAR